VPRRGVAMTDEGIKLLVQLLQTVADDNSANRRRDAEILAQALEEIAKALNGVAGALKRKK
jgi:hypothetical protein